MKASSLCVSCTKANVSCPIYEPGQYVERCVEHRPTLRGAAIEEADQLRKLGSRSDVFRRAALELEEAAHLFPPNVKSRDETPLNNKPIENYE